MSDDSDASAWQQDQGDANEEAENHGVFTREFDGEAEYGDEAVPE